MKKTVSVILAFVLCFGFTVIGFADMVPYGDFSTIRSISEKRFMAEVKNPDGAKALNNPDICIDCGWNVYVDKIEKNDQGIIVVYVNSYSSNLGEGDDIELDIKDLSGSPVTSYYLTHPVDLIMKLINDLAELFSNIGKKEQAA